MSTIAIDSGSWVGNTLIDAAHRKLGTIEEIYVDEEDERPLWMVVRIGHLRARHTFVPLAMATCAGTTVTTPYERAEIEAAPSIDLAEEVPEEQLRELHEHYGLQYGQPIDAPRATPAERVRRYLA